MLFIAMLGKVPATAIVPAQTGTVLIENGNNLLEILRDPKNQELISKRTPQEIERDKALMKKYLKIDSASGNNATKEMPHNEMISSNQYKSETAK